MANADWMAEVGLRAGFWLPLVAGQRDLGLVSVGFAEPRVFTPSDREAALASHEEKAEYRKAALQATPSFPQGFPVLLPSAVSVRAVRFF